MKNLTTIKDLVVQFSIDEFVDKTVVQINKDLSSYSIKTIVKTESKDVLSLMIGQLLPIVKELFESERLEQFTYRVDLSEKKWIYFIQGFDFEYLSEQIIIREAQKVYLRELFSTK